MGFAHSRLAFQPDDLTAPGASGFDQGGQPRQFGLAPEERPAQACGDMRPGRGAAAHDCRYRLLSLFAFERDQPL